MSAHLQVGASTTMTIRLSAELKRRLGRLATGMHRSRCYLAAEAVAAYVDRELAIIDGVGRGLADVSAGRTVDHETAMDQVDALIAEVRHSRA